MSLLCFPFSTWFNLQIMKFWVLRKSSIIVKTRCFHGLSLIHNQNFRIKIKTIKKFSNSAHYSLEFSTKFSQVSWWVLWVKHPRNLPDSFFVKNCYLNLNFLKKRKKNEKWKNVKQQQYCFTLTFLYGKMYILLENIFGKTFVSSHTSNWLYLLRNCFSNYVYQRYVYNIERNRKNSVCIGVKNFANLFVNV